MPHEGIGPYGKTTRDYYDAEVTFTDIYVGRLMDFVAAQPWGARTAFIVTGDHGEAFGEHHQYVHGFELWENLVRVPLFMVLPGVRPRHVDRRTSALDLAPTILDLLGVNADGGPAGRTALPRPASKAAASSPSCSVRRSPRATWSSICPRRATATAAAPSSTTT